MPSTAIEEIAILARVEVLNTLKNLFPGSKPQSSENTTSEFP